MRWRSLKTVFCVPAAALLLPLAASAPGGRLEYRATVHFRGESAPVVTRFALRPAPVVATRNRTKKPRMTRWHLETAQGGQATGFTQAALLARLERMLYFSTPVPGLVRTPVFIRFNNRKCQVWQVTSPPGLQVYAYLVEAAPGILALSYLSGSFEKGDLASIEIHLEDFALRSGAAPAEDGTVLLTTLQRMADAQAQAESGPVDGEIEVIE